MPKLANFLISNFTQNRLSLLKCLFFWLLCICSSTLSNLNILFSRQISSDYNNGWFFNFLIFKGVWRVNGETIEQIIKRHSEDNFFLDEVPFDDLNDTLLDLAVCVRLEKYLWIACRNHTTPIPKPVPSKFSSYYLSY